MAIKAIILAAGKGTRMRSDFLKVAHKVAGRMIVDYVVQAVLGIEVDEILIVVGHQSDVIKNQLTHPKIKFVTQREQLGTGHAVLQTETAFSPDQNDVVIVLAGDCPLIQPETLENLLAIHKEANASATILTTELEDPGTYGRILRGKMGTVAGIREAKDCTEDELKINEINTGAYCFCSKQLFKALHQIRPTNTQKEYYLTDVIQILKEKGKTVEAYCTPDRDQVIGVNTRMDLASINKIIYKRNNLSFMKAGVTLIDPETTFIDSTAKIGHDTVIEPFCMIVGNSHIGQHSYVGAHSYVRDGEFAAKTVLPPYTRVGIN